MATQELLTFLGFCALFLGVVNGLLLFRSYIRDRSKLIVSPILPEVYQWYFDLPAGTHEGQPTRKYGFLAYIAISNSGLRDVSIDSWHLNLKTIAGESFELKPIAITEPEIIIGEMAAKKYPVLGAKGVYFEGSTMVRSGDGINGFAYYVAEFYGEDNWNPLIENEKVVGTLIVKSVFDNKEKTKITFSRITLAKAQSMIPHIETVV